MTSLRKFTITNETQYTTSSLTRLVKRVWGWYTPRYSSPHNVRIRFVYRRSGCGYGYAWYNSERMVVCLNRDLASETVKNVVDTILHEFYHCRGIRHGDMPKSMEPERVGLDNLVLAQYAPVERRAARQATPEEKIVRLEERLTRWITKRRRAETAIAKIQKQIKRALRSHHQ